MIRNTFLALSRRVSLALAALSLAACAWLALPSVWRAGEVWWRVEVHWRVNVPGVGRCFHYRTEQTQFGRCFPAPTATPERVIYGP